MFLLIYEVLLSGGKLQGCGDSSANFCSSDFRILPMPFILLSSSYYSDFLDSNCKKQCPIDGAADLLRDFTQPSVSSNDYGRLEEKYRQGDIKQNESVKDPLLRGNLSTEHESIPKKRKRIRSPRGDIEEFGPSAGIPTLELQSSDVFCRSLLDSSISSVAEERLLSDQRWVLLAGYQASYLGQLYRLFETMSTCKSTMNGTLDPGLKGNGYPGEVSPRSNGSTGPSDRKQQNSSLWEESLKKYFRPGQMWEEFIEPKDRRVPFLVRPPLQEKSDGSSLKYSAEGAHAHATWDSVEYFQWVLNRLHCGHHFSNSDEKLQYSAPAIRVSDLSDFTLFELYLRAAVRQIRELSQSVGGGIENSASLEAGEINLILHIFYALGVAIGLAMRYGVALLSDLMLSDECWKIIVGEDAKVEELLNGFSTGHKVVVSENLKGSFIRRGITAVVPEVGF